MVYTHIYHCWGTLHLYNITSRLLGGMALILAADTFSVPYYVHSTVWLGKCIQGMAFVYQDFPLTWCVRLFHVITLFFDCTGLCFDCTGLCFDCTSLCFDCTGLCFDCTGLCFDCTGLCFDCTSLCFDCTGLCFDCTSLCFDCTSLCFDCTSLCFDCTGLCFDCTSLCFDCTGLCFDCTSLCFDCTGLQLLNLTMCVWMSFSVSCMSKWFLIEKNKPLYIYAL